MEPFAEPQTVDDTDAPVRAALRYLSNRLAYLDDPRAIGQPPRAAGERGRL